MKRCCKDKASPKTFDRVGNPPLILYTMKKTQITNRETLIASILASKAMAPAGTTHCSNCGHCTASL